MSAKEITSRNDLSQCVQEEIVGMTDCFETFATDGFLVTLPAFPGCFFSLTPTIYVCNNISGVTEIFVGDINLDPWDPSDSCLNYTQAHQEANDNGTLDQFYIDLHREAYVLVDELIKDAFSILGGSFIQTTYTISSCAAICGVALSPEIDPNNSPVVDQKIDCGQECCKRVINYELGLFDEYIELSDILFSPESPCEDNFECKVINGTTTEFSICAGQCEVLTGF